MLDYELMRPVSQLDVVKATTKAAAFATVEFCGAVLLVALFQTVTWTKEPTDLIKGLVAAFLLFFAFRWGNMRAKLSTERNHEQRLAALEESDGKRD